MHPQILQQLVTDRVNDVTATAAGSRRAREARRIRRARTSEQTPPGRPGTQPEFQPAATPRLNGRDGPGPGQGVHGRNRRDLGASMDSSST
jgi:hypothetical protein